MPVPPTGCPAEGTSDGVAETGEGTVLLTTVKPRGLVATKKHTTTLRPRIRAGGFNTA